MVDSTDTITYNAYVTGRTYEAEDYPKLDSINFHISHKYYQTNTITTIEKIKPQKRNIIHLQPQITGGYDIINKQFGITVGIGLGIDI